MHTSVLINTPCELINLTPYNPLISRCQIKVCYVGDEPNRNGSIITKEVAREMANSLPGSPIVGFYNENTGDFEEHNRRIEISGGVLKFEDTTRPYGFVDLNAKVWFQDYMDEGVVHTYMVTEGWLWTGPSFLMAFIQCSCCHLSIIQAVYSFVDLRIKGVQG